VFDVKNLQLKIEEFRINIDKIRPRAAELEQQQSHFVTEVKENYKSPYKSVASAHDERLAKIQKEHRLLTSTQNFFFTHKYPQLGASVLTPNTRMLNSHQHTQSSSTDLLRVLQDHTSPKRQRVRP
jgi:hypothetical protein